MGMKEYAIEYAKRGFAVLPLKHKGKDPIFKGGFLEATTDLEQIETWWTEKPHANVGIATGEMSGGIAVIDLDIKPDQGIDGGLALKEWESKHGSFPDTVCVTTGGGGRHLYYKVDKPFSCARGIIEGVDVRCNGGYVVAPGSVHSNGNLYEWDYSPDEIEIAPANSSVYALLELMSADVNNTAFKSPEVIKAGARVDTLFKMTCSLQAKNLSDEAIKAAVRTENAERCQPPLTEKELEKEVFPALQRYEKGVANKSEPLKKKVEPLKMLSASEIMDMDLPKITFHVNSILADGVTILSAKSKYYKSWLCLQLALAVASGKHFLGYPTVQSDVLYLDLENDLRVTQDRLAKVSGGDKIPDNIYIVNECARMGSGFEEQIEKALADNPKIGVVIIDVLQYVKFNKTSRETDYECDYKTFKYLKSLTRERPLSIICVHHNRKMTDDSDPFSNMLGSTALMGATDEEIIIHKRKREDKDATISITGRTVQSVDLIGYFDLTQYKWVLRGTQEEVFNMDRQSRYDNDPVVKAIKAILSEQKEWQGTINDFVVASTKLGFRFKQKNNQEIGHYLSSKDFVDSLSVYDNISVTKKKAGAVRYVVFSKIT